MFEQGLRLTQVGKTANSRWARSVRRLTLDSAKVTAEQRGGHCLSETYINSGEKLVWQCQQDHTWEATLENVKYNQRWCPTCAGNRKLDLAHVQRVAHQRKGKSLSLSYINSQEPLQWECALGHQWWANLGSVSQGTWCPTCAGCKTYTLGDMRQLASDRGGRCVSSTYKDVHTHLDWECSLGHRWKATATSLISRKSWCPTCAGCAKLSLADMQEVASARGGVCLSSVYLNNRAKLLWRCASGHTWESKATHVIQGSWCPYCLEHVGEKSCRDWLEAHFGVLFPKVWPSWLTRSDTGRPLQLDGYNDQLRLAFEYQGAQHYRFSPPFHRTLADFEGQLLRDREKSVVCYNQGVTLIVVPFTTKLHNIPTFMEQAVSGFQVREVG